MFLARPVKLMSLSFPAGHVNMLMLGSPPKGEGIAPPTEIEQRALERIAKFWESGSAYAMLHGTKPSTAGLAIASSPQALLAWYAYFLFLSQPNRREQRVPQIPSWRQPRR